MTGCEIWYFVSIGRSRNRNEGSIVLRISAIAIVIGFLLTSCRETGLDPSSEPTVNVKIYRNVDLFNSDTVVQHFNQVLLTTNDGDWRFIKSDRVTVGGIVLEHEGGEVFPIYRSYVSVIGSESEPTCPITIDDFLGRKITTSCPFAKRITIPTLQRYDTISISRGWSGANSTSVPGDSIVVRLTFDAVYSELEVGSSATSDGSTVLLTVPDTGELILQPDVLRALKPNLVYQLSFSKNERYSAVVQGVKVNSSSDFELRTLVLVVP